jgi:hypothetical protein
VVEAIVGEMWLAMLLMRAREADGVDWERDCEDDDDDGGAMVGCDGGMSFCK